jgi:signal transduction histidine kinase
VNLLANAVQATPAGGAIRVETSEAPEDALPVRLTITNTGSIIAQRDLHNVFQPFFTTKEEGSGLGLAIARQILRSHGGEITAESGDTFTRFVVQLPRSGARTPPTTATEP